MSRSLVTRLSALGLVAAGTMFACAGAPPVPPTTPAPAPSPAKTEASPAASPLPTTLMPGIGMATSKPNPDPEEDDEASGPVPPCVKDEDCWSKTCCPARAPEECVHALKARKCAIVDVSCAKTPMHYTCVCDSGQCKGRLAPP